MTDTLTIAVAQLDPTVGDVIGNIAKIRAARAEAEDMGADLVVCSELVVSGYPPEDLVLRPIFQDAVEGAVKALAVETGTGPAVLLGAPWRANGALHNAALLLDGGEIAEIRFKHVLPNYGVFDELRVFAPADLPEAMEFRGTRLGVMICEDMWTPGAVAHLKQSGAEILIVINGSPFETDKADERLSLAALRVKESGLGLIYVNQVGGQDELVFDGASFVLGAKGERRGQAAGFRTDVMAAKWQRTDAGGWDCVDCKMVKLPQGPEAVYLAMVVGLRDYVAKNGFPGVLIGLSGGIDSALTAVVAADALGADKVHCVLMPSPFTSTVSIEDARALAGNLGIRLDTIAIDPAMEAFATMLAQQFTDTAPDETEENIQARSRGMTLMALSNKFGRMVLSTGNKSEMSVGYATLYGDLCGGYSVLKDVYKTTVYELTHWRNEYDPAEGGDAVADCLGPPGPVIPKRIITKAPSAELKPDQTDQDTLPPYEALDDILKCLIEGEMALADIAKRGHAPEVVARVWRMVNIAEYKRRQAPPGVKLTRRSFGRDRRYPITNAFSGPDGAKT